MVGGFINYRESFTCYMRNLGQQGHPWWNTTGFEVMEHISPPTPGRDKWRHKENEQTPGGHCRPRSEWTTLLI